MKQATIFEEVSLQRQKSKPFGLQIKKTPEFVKHWNEVHEKTNWDSVQYDLLHNKKLKEKLLFKMIGTGEARDYCGDFFTEGCDNYLNHPSEMNYAQNRRLSCKRAECPICWDTWLIKESSRVTERIEKFRLLAQRRGWRSSKPIHVIVSPPKWLWYLPFDEFKKEFRKMAERAGIVGGVSMFHAFRLNKNTNTWFYSPHFHLIGYGWVKDTKKISSEKGWIIKNKGIRESSSSVYSTVSYLLSHTAIAKGVHSVTWFGDLSYRSKYAMELKRDVVDIDGNKCPYCSQYLVKFEIYDTDRPPPDKEWSGLVERFQARPVETIDEMLERKFWLKNQLRERARDSEFYWNESCRKAQQVADDLIKSLQSP